MSGNISIDKAAPSGLLTPGGARLRAFLDSLPVEADWIAGHRIVWQTGQQDGPNGVGPEDHTHCSAYVAAVALYLEIYVLRPPNHSQELLANAQVNWLHGGSYPGPSAADSGWQALGLSGEAGVLANAVAAANAGKLVVAGYIQPPITVSATGKLVNKPGHAVIVRPQGGEIPPDTGPSVTMASDRNWQSIRMKPAFSAHAGAWPGAVRLFMHDTVLETEYTAGDGLG